MSLQRQHDGAAAERPGGRLGTVLGALLAALVAAGLAYWASSGDRRALGSAPQASLQPAQARAYPPARPDPAQVGRAYERLGVIYSERGLNGVMDAVDGCGRSVSADPGKLDFCVALAIDAAALAAGSGDPLVKAWRAGLEPRQLALIRDALPAGSDPAKRLAAVEQLTHTVSRGAPGGPILRRPHAGRRPLVLARKASSSRRGERSSGVRCRLLSTPVERVICAHPSLQADDRRLREAYRRALSHGADPRQLAGDQVRWDVAVTAAAPDARAVSRLYRGRTRQLLALAAGRRRLSSW